MAQAAVPKENQFLLLGEALLVAASLPFVALLIIFVRPLFILAGLASLLLMAVSARFRSWLASTAEYKGLRLADDVSLHPSHSWARIFPRHVLAGADDLVLAALGPVQRVELPDVGRRVVQGEPLFCLRRGNRMVQVRAPISGVVLARNESLREHPDYLNDAPFGKGWVVRLRAEDRGQAGRLFRGRRALGWFHGEVDRLISSLHLADGGYAFLADGGIVAEDLYEQIDDRAWERLTQSFFAGPSPAA